MKFAAEPETVIMSSDRNNDDRVRQLEEALDAAAKERQEILEAADKEIEYHRSIAAELETSMINDFEWKLHEIEAEYNRKLREGGVANDQPQPSTSRRRSPIKSVIGAAGGGHVSAEQFEARVQEAKNEIVRQKDGELAKMHIQVITLGARVFRNQKLRTYSKLLFSIMYNIHRFSSQCCPGSYNPHELLLEPDQLRLIR